MQKRALKDVLEMKYEIDQAVAVAARCISEDYAFYVSCLPSEEELEEAEEVRDAWVTLSEYGITLADLQKHTTRQVNKPEEPIRFIDRPHFVAIETEDLPF